MIQTIIKRDGRERPFNREKVAQAIYKAAKSVGGNDFSQSLTLADDVCTFLQEKYPAHVPNVEQVQDAVERILVEDGHTQTAKAYILYRAQRTQIRDMNSQLMKTYKDLTFKNAADNDVKRENANVDGDTAMGTMLKYGSEGAKTFNEMFVLEPAHAAAHQSGDIHIHDLDFLTLTTTCCQIDLIKLFKDGFSTGHGHLREPNDIQSYSALACLAIQSNQNDQHGGQSLPVFEYAMAQGVAKSFQKIYRSNLIKALELSSTLENPEKLVKIIQEKILHTYETVPTMEDNETYLNAEYAFLLHHLPANKASHVQAIVLKNSLKEIDRATFQAMEAFVHNLNTMHSRAGAQVPFSSINYGTDTSPEGRLVIKNILLATEKGLGNGETPIFPIHIFKVKEGVNYNPEDPNYDLFKLACRVSAKRLFPNFSFIDAPFNLQYYKPGNIHSEVAYMGCRTRVIGNVYDSSREIVSGRGNLSFTSINLPRIALNSKGNLDFFYDELAKLVDLTIAQLLGRLEVQSSKRVRNFPFLMGQGIWQDSEWLAPDDKIGEVLKHGTLSIGFIGLAETLTALLGQHHGESEIAAALGIDIVTYLRNRTDEKSAEMGLNFSLIATPAEGLAGRFVRIDQKKYGVVRGVTDKDYYTNSFHVPVGFQISAFDKIQIEAPYHALTNAGHISYVELDGNPSYNLEAFESVIRCMKESGIGYGSINHPIDRDPVCGYSGIIENECPGCGRKEDEDGVPFERIRRITGYLVGTLDRFNNAKQAEVTDRVKHI